VIDQATGRLTRAVLVTLLAATLGLPTAASPAPTSDVPSPDPAGGTMQKIAASNVLGIWSAAAAVQPALASFRLEARYDADLHLDWDSRRLRLRTVIEVRNITPSSFDHLDLNTVAARFGGLRRLRARVEGDTVRARAFGQTIRVPLAPVLAPGETRTVVVSFRARLRTTSASRTYFFTKIRGVAQLYRVIPWLSRAIPFSGQGHGEPFLTPVSPRVEVTLSSDRKLVWATSGRRVRRDGPRRETHRAFDVRDFVITASPSYRIAQGRSRDRQTQIVAYTRRHQGRRWIDLARTELSRYEKLTGVQYPYRTFRIAESTAGLAMEAPALIWIPDTRSAVDHAFLISHETAHQWWYSLVGNDQSTSAFADEALADYFSRKARSGLRGSQCRRDRLDREIRAYSSACYFEVIYIQGALFLDQLRKDFGSRKFKRAIRAYTRANRLGIGSNKALLEAFREEMGNSVLRRYRARFPSLY
jgi:hypothetical protein